MLSELLEASDGTIVIYGKFGFDELGALLKFGMETPQNHFLQKIFNVERVVGSVG